MTDVVDSQTGTRSNGKRKRITPAGERACLEYFQSQPDLTKLPRESAKLSENHPEFYELLTTHQLDRAQVDRQLKKFRTKRFGEAPALSNDQIREMVEKGLKPLSVMLKSVYCELLPESLVSERGYMPDVLKAISEDHLLWQPRKDIWVDLFTKFYPKTSRTLHASNLDFNIALYDNRLDTADVYTSRILNLGMFPDPFPACRGIKTKEQLARHIFIQFDTSLSSHFKSCFASQSLDDLTIPDGVYEPPKPVAEVLFYLAGYMIRQLLRRGAK